MAQPQPQPNYQRLADAFTAASEECSRLPNIPAINDSQTLVDLIGELRNEMRTGIRTMSTAVATIQADIGIMRTDITAIQADITIIRTDITAIHSRLDAR